MFEAVPAAGRRDGRVRVDDGGGSGQARQAMTEFAQVVRNRRMTRAFEPTAVARRVIERDRRPGVAGAERRQDAGVASRGARGRRRPRCSGTRRCRRSAATRFAGSGCSARPSWRLPLADPTAYTERYSEPDKAATGLGQRARGLAGAVLDDRRVDVGDDAAARGGGRGARRPLLRGLPRRDASSASGWGSRPARAARRDRAGHAGRGGASTPGRSAARPRRQPQRDHPSGVVVTVASLAPPEKRSGRPRGRRAVGQALDRVLGRQAGDSRGRRTRSRPCDPPRAVSRTARPTPAPRRAARSSAPGARGRGGRRRWRSR